MAILFLLPLLVHLVAGTMVPQEGGKMGIELVTIHGGSLSCVRFTQAGVAQEKSRTVGTC